MVCRTLTSDRWDILIVWIASASHDRSISIRMAGCLEYCTLMILASYVLYSDHFIFETHNYVFTLQSELSESRPWASMMYHCLTVLPLTPWIYTSAYWDWPLLGPMLHHQWTFFKAISSMCCKESLSKGNKRLNFEHCPHFTEVWANNLWNWVPQTNPRTIQQ